MLQHLFMKRQILQEITCSHCVAHYVPYGWTLWVTKPQSLITGNFTRIRKKQIFCFSGRCRVSEPSLLTQPHTHTSIISFSASNPPQISNPAPRCFSDIYLSKMAHTADVDFSFSRTVFLGTSKAAGINLALFSITEHQRHLTDAEQRFGLKLGESFLTCLTPDQGKR